MIELVKLLAKYSGKGKSDIQIAREYVGDAYKNKKEMESKAQNLLRSARRHHELW